MEIKGDLHLDLLAKGIRQKLAYRNELDEKGYSEWKANIKEKLFELLGMERIAENACPVRVQIEEETQKEGYKHIRFVFESEKGAFVPCCLLIPDTGKEKYPVAITLQGHSSMGMKASVNEPDPDNPAQVEYANRACFAVQAVRNGYAALAVEQRGMGLRRPPDPDRNGNMCTYEALTSLLYGRTILGGRIWDISRAIDALGEFPQADVGKILITGNSGGGTTSYYAACYDERIQLAVPSCAFCTYEDSIIFREHCVCNYIPQAYRWFEMQDLSCLIAPRRLAIVAGKKDGIFLIDGVRKGFETVQKIYRRENAADFCRLVETEESHYWCKELVWDTINQETKKMGW